MDDDEDPAVDEVDGSAEVCNPQFKLDEGKTGLLCEVVDGKRTPSSLMPPTVIAVASPAAPARVPSMVSISILILPPGLMVSAVPVVRSPPANGSGGSLYGLSSLRACSSCSRSSSPIHVVLPALFCPSLASSGLTIPQ